MKSRLTLALCLAGLAMASPADARARWTPAQANAWYARQPWLVGANYLPANAINQLEMWQAETFDPATIDKELGWAEGLGMNTMRVFLHDLVWQQDPQGYRRRIDAFLAIAARHHIRPMFVLFDSCWDPFPKLGPQHPPVPGLHNSGWVQGPGAAALIDERQDARLETYVKGVIGAFARDDRVLAWDVWNEPTSPAAIYKGQPADKEALVARLLPKVFAWAQTADPSQPLTSGLANGPVSGAEDWSPTGKHIAIDATQLAQSDILSFHDYSFSESFRRRIAELRPWGRPILCTEYMARSVGSTFDTILPIGKRENIAMYNWGFVIGKEQTNLPWDSMWRPYVHDEPMIWFHDVLRADGTPYRQAEADLIRGLARAPRGVVPLDQ